MPRYRRPLITLSWAILFVLLSACGRSSREASSLGGASPTATTATPAASASAAPASVVSVPAATSRVPPASTPSSQPQPAPTPKPGGSGVEGSLVWNPPCRQAHPACGMPSRLLEGEVSAKHNGTVVARTHTARYRFVLTLQPGTYVLNAKPDDPNYPSCTPVTVDVPPGKYVNVGMECQSK